MTVPVGDLGALAAVFAAFFLDSALNNRTVKSTTAKPTTAGTKSCCELTSCQAATSFSFNSSAVTIFLALLVCFIDSCNVQQELMQTGSADFAGAGVFEKHNGFTDWAGCRREQPARTKTSLRRNHSRAGGAGRGFTGNGSVHDVQTCIPQQIGAEIFLRLGKGRQRRACRGTARRARGSLGFTGVSLQRTRRQELRDSTCCKDYTAAHSLASDSMLPEL